MFIQGIDGYNKTLTGEALASLSGAASDFHHVHGVLWRGHYTVSLSNSNGGQVMPTISAVEYKMAQKQKDAGGGYCMCKLKRKESYA